MARTGMMARGLKASRRMARGPDSTVYVLVKSTGLDALEEAASTSDSHVTRNDDGTAVLHITEDSTVTVTALRRAAAFAIASGVSGYRIWRRLSESQPAYGEASRVWSFGIAPTGQTFTLAVERLLETGDGRFLEDGTARRLDA